MNKNEIKTSRRTMLVAGAAAVASVGVASRAVAQQKIDKSLVLYQQSPKDDQQCSKCLHFQPPNACAIVAGEINPNGWCGAFAPKA